MANESTSTVFDGPQEPKTPTVPGENHDNFKVGWEDPADQDPENPMNWSAGRKWSIIGILSFITFLTPLASSMMAPGVPVIMAEFGTTNDEVATFMVSVFVLGFAFGPLLMAPLSELYGRTPVYHVCNSLFIVFSIGCAVSQNVGMLIAFRFLSGFVGVATVTCGSGSIADMVPAEQRGAAMSVWSIGPLLGPVIGPVCAGFLVEAKGWRWVFWVTTIVSGAVVLASFFVLHETYAPVLLERKAAKLRKETGNDKYYSSMQAKGTPRETFNAAITRPTRMFLFSPIVTMVCVYIATLYGMLYLLFTTFTFVYQDIYGFSSVGAGLSFIAGGVGNLLGLMFVGYLSDKLIRDSKGEGKTIQPEQRLDLRLTVPTALSLPVGLIMYGWTAQERLHWIVPMIGTGIMGFGMIGIFMISQTYLVDAFTLHAASVTAANAVLRSLLGALLPLCGLKLYDKLDLGWGNTLLGLIALALAPVPWLLHTFGGRIRNNPRFRKDF
ncbi:multidrug resistant [Fusarium albosuccineum]|uniref:Multidrug resistant n=1 Tax=Fusarium albosuccineum TaxID=1237068 RepID=A0A8H4LMR5_9HYPO|nr:multidrug resistant [Fusarium albosuccineum]